MSAYKYGDYFYFKNTTNKPNKHHNHFILNQIPYFHITSPFKLRDDILESLPKLFVDKILKQWMKSYVQIVAHISKVSVCNKQNQKLEPIYNAGKQLWIF